MGKTERRARKREKQLQGRSSRAAATTRPASPSWLIGGVVAVVVVVGVIALVLVLSHKSSKKTPAKSASGGSSVTSAPSVPGVTCTTAKPPRGSTATCTKPPAMTIDPTKTYVATMTTNCGTITIALDPKEAPKTVNSFVFLAQHHFYDGLIFHRVVPDFVIQGGDPTGTGTGGPGYVLPTEPPKNGYTAGSVAMANTSQPNSTGSQFFMTWTANGAKGLGGPPYLYSILGQITKGLDVVKQMGAYAPSSGDGPPTHPLYIDTVTISES